MGRFEDIRAQWSVAWKMEAVLKHRAAATAGKGITTESRNRSSETDYLLGFSLVSGVVSATSSMDRLSSEADDIVSLKGEGRIGDDVEMWV